MFKYVICAKYCNVFSRCCNVNQTKVNQIKQLLEAGEEKLNADMSLKKIIKNLKMLTIYLKTEVLD
jgi:hypothetical protein